MRYLLSLIIIGTFNGILFADSADYDKKGKWLSTAPYSKVSGNLDPALPVDMCLFEFNPQIFPAETAKVLIYSIDGQNHKAYLENGENLKILTNPGLHVFQFYVSGYSEIMTDSLLILPQYRDVYQLNFQEERIDHVIFKPVIYLYPAHKTEVVVTMDINGDHAFLYPSYGENWKFTAHPNGDLAFGANTYNYLFWEANADNPVQLDRRKEGFIVAKNEVVSFLEDKLEQANLTSKEKADFITFWGPRLMQNDLNFVHFIFNETCLQYAEIDIQPAPSSFYRIYILYAPITESFDVNPQKMKSANRKGFHVIEWGGQETSLSEFSAQLMH